MNEEPNILQYFPEALNSKCRVFVLAKWLKQFNDYQNLLRLCRSTNQLTVQSYQPSNIKQQKPLQQNKTKVPHHFLHHGMIIETTLNSGLFSKWNE